jgi:hypothetical protein
MATDQPRGETESQLHRLLDRLLVKDVAVHERVLEELGSVGDERVVPHLVEVLYLDTVANNWEKFGFPEIARREPTPRPLAHPEVRWPGIVDALCEIAPPDFDNRETAWLKWESWSTQNEIEPLEGFGDWKVQFYKTYHPLVGHVMDVSPAVEDFHQIRWGSCDLSTLHPINGARFLPAAETDYVQDDDLVYGFEIEDQAYAVPRFVHFPHEMVNAELQGRPICLSLCTMCNSPILYDRRAAGREFQFGSSGLVWQGNKAMYDEETGSLWNQQTGKPIGGEMYEEGDVSLEFLPITQESWADWLADNPDTQVLDPDTGYDWDYDYYRDYDGFIKRHYWENENALHPGVREPDQGLSGKLYVYGVEGPEDLRVYPVEAVQENEPVHDAIGDTDVVVVSEGEDVAVYEAPPGPVEVQDGTLVDGDGTSWEVTHGGLRAGDEALERVAGRHGLWLSFRPHYDEYTVVRGE